MGLDAVETPRIMEIEKDLLKVYLKHGYGDLRLYMVTGLSIPGPEYAAMKLEDYANVFGIKIEQTRPRRVELIEG